MVSSLSRFSKEKFGKRIVPQKILSLKYQQELNRLYHKLYYNNIHYGIIANLFAFACALAVLIFVVAYPYLFDMFRSYFEQSVLWSFVIMWISFGLIAWLSYYLVLLFFFFYHAQKFKRHEAEIERDLPEFLDNIVSNLKGAVPLERALMKSARKEQKALVEEVVFMNERLLTGQSIHEVLDSFRKKFESPIINRTVFLMQEGVRSGGDLARPLAKISDNLKSVYHLQDEIKTSASGSTLIIRAITVLVAPMLFALGMTLLNFISQLFELISSTSSDILSVQPVPAVFQSYLSWFSIAMITLITIFSGLITAQFKNEKAYEVLKYLPFYLAISLAMFYFSFNILQRFFGNVIF